MMRFKCAPPGFFISPNCTIVGDVTIGQNTSVWFNAVIRGDVAPVKIGKRVNIQDLALIHCDTDVPNIIEDDVSIGHNAVVHGAFVGAGTLIGMHATLLGRTKIGKECLIAAGAVLPPGMEVPDRSVVMGVPGRIVRSVSEEDLKYLRWLPGRYVELAERYVIEGFPDVCRS
jgi:carbonic anhydrase/acetyltransferase-like protein (isoleucine patch superfamily)